jgi:hypothetical protein
MDERRGNESIQTKAYSSEKYTQIVLISLVATANKDEIRQCVITGRIDCLSDITRSKEISTCRVKVITS